MHRYGTEIVTSSVLRYHIHILYPRYGPMPGANKQPQAAKASVSFPASEVKKPQYIKIKAAFQRLHWSCQTAVRVREKRTTTRRLQTAANWWLPGSAFVCFSLIVLVAALPSISGAAEQEWSTTSSCGSIGTISAQQPLSLSLSLPLAHVHARSRPAACQGETCVC